MPGMLEKMPQAHWSTRETLALTGDAASGFQKLWKTPIFDLRPEFTAKDGLLSTAIAINRSAGLGAGAKLRVIIFNESPTGVDPAVAGALQLFTWEAGNDQPPRQPNQGGTNSPLFRLTKETDITRQMTAGGLTSTVGGVSFTGGSLVYWTPIAETIRFWQVHLRLFNRNTAAVFGLQASVY